MKSIAAAAAIFGFATFGVIAALPGVSQGAAMLDEEVCAELGRYEAAGLVDYQPGVTARGERVAPADIRKADDVSPKPDSIDISVLLQDRYLVPRERAVLRGEIPVSRFVTGPDGRMLFAGQLLAVEDQAEISGFCLRHYGRKG